MPTQSLRVVDPDLSHAPEGSRSDAADAPNGDWRTDSYSERGELATLLPLLLPRCCTCSRLRSPIQIFTCHPDIFIFYLFFFQEISSPS